MKTKEQIQFDTIKPYALSDERLAELSYVIMPLSQVSTNVVYELLGHIKFLQEQLKHD